MDFFGTEKFFQNRTLNPIPEETVKGLFMSASNRAHLKAELAQQGIQIDTLELQAKMGVWSRKNKINDKYSSDSNATRNENQVIVVQSLNSQFINDIKGQQSSFDKPLQTSVRVQEYKNIRTLMNSPNSASFNDTGNDETVIQDGVLTACKFNEPDHLSFESKKATYMTVADYQVLDVYDPKYDRDLYAQAIGMSMKRQRRNDMQKYLHKRHVYGYHNGEGNADGYRSAESERASLDNLSRGFDMSKFRRHANNIKRPESAYQFQV